MPPDINRTWSFFPPVAGKSMQNRGLREKNRVKRALRQSNFSRIASNPINIIALSNHLDRTTDRCTQPRRQLAVWRNLPVASSFTQTYVRHTKHEIPYLKRHEGTVTIEEEKYVQCLWIQEPYVILLLNLFLLLVD